MRSQIACTNAKIGGARDPCLKIRLTTSSKSISTITRRYPNLHAISKPDLSSHNSATTTKEIPILWENPPNQCPPMSQIIPLAPANPELPLDAPSMFDFTYPTGG